MFKSCCNLPPKEFFIRGASLSFGIWIFYAGLAKWVGGASSFVGYINSQFDPTWSPAILNTLLGWIIVIAEPLLGIWLVTGIKNRCAWSCTALLMFVLVLGQTILKKPEVVANWQYFVFCLFCAAWATDSKCSA